MKTRLLILAVLIFNILGACSVDSDDDNGDKMSTLKGEHVWKSQTDALKQAQDVSKLAKDAMQKQRKAMEKLNNEQ